MPTAIAVRASTRRREANLSSSVVISTSRPPATMMRPMAQRMGLKRRLSF